GFDFLGIVRAVFQNFSAGRVVAGASTLTQQTAKNLYSRPDRSFRSKIEEAVNALRLEHYYSKEQILEFYANQFHVNANGRGIGIAARYFFDKDVKKLTTIECAFIAGLVKGPNLYNPFNKTEKEAKVAVDAAHQRTLYVVNRMLKYGYLTQAEHAELKEMIDTRQIPFRRGVFRYEDSVIIGEVISRLSSPEIKEILSKAGIENPSTAGLRIVTTLDRHTQASALYGVRHHLSEIGPYLTGIPDMKHEKNMLPKERLSKEPSRLSFHYAMVDAVGSDSLTLDVQGYPCAVNADSLMRTATILARAEKGRFRKGSVNKLLAEFSVGDVLYVSIAERGNCDIELQTDLQGATLAVQDDKIVAMVGGYSNKDFNRALNAKRQLGSVWKTVIYAAAMHLGWSPLDELDNRHSAFPFERVWYYPRAGHKAPDSVSLAWTGVHSENKASVWLLYHLTAHLSVKRLKELVSMVGLERQEDESRKEYIERIRDRFGVISTRRYLDAVAFNHAKRDMLDAMGVEAWPLISLTYGQGAQKQLQKVKTESQRISTSFNWLQLQKRRTVCDEEYRKLVLYFESRENMESMLVEQGPAAIGLPLADEVGHLWLGDDFIGCGLHEQEPLVLEDVALWSELLPLRYDGLFPQDMIEDLDRKMIRLRLAHQNDDYYSLSYLIHHPDFLFLVHAHYIALLANRMGVSEKIRPIQSLPLGAVELSLDEAISLYQGLITGNKYVVSKENRFRLIDKIYYRPHPFTSDETVDEVLLYEAQTSMEEVADPITGMQVADILRNVVQYGTGRRMKRGITHNGLNYPLLGKTGTTNQFANAAFCGLVPKTNGENWEFDGGLFVGTYVGFDRPEPMLRGQTKISGAMGALPIWTRTVQGAIEAGLLGEGDSSPSWKTQADTAYQKVDLVRGVSTEAGEADVLFFSSEESKNTIGRRYAPVQVKGGFSVELMGQMSDDFTEDTGVDIFISPEE
ncbi:MAG: transglycosylase domain-containing protein, partial [Myxococcota bacterium]|nr:transglycosylase domain-containing protein [Myxococcota bacterium]